MGSRNGDLKTSLFSNFRLAISLEAWPGKPCGIREATIPQGKYAHFVVAQAFRPPILLHSLVG